MGSGLAKGERRAAGLADRVFGPFTIHRRLFKAYVVHAKDEFVDGADRPPQSRL